MNDHSRTKKRCQEAIIFHCPSRDLHQQPGRCLARPRERVQPSRSFARDLLIISRAYQESEGGNCIEDMLMQRDYIID
jgi:hypothetical protein